MIMMDFFVCKDPFLCSVEAMTKQCILHHLEKILKIVSFLIPVPKILKIVSFLIPVPSVIFNKI